MEKIKELLETSSFPGISNILKNKNWIIKIIWIICYLGFLAGCGYFLSIQFQSYLNYEVATTSDVIREEESEFPTVNFCIPSDFNGTHWIRKNLSEILLDTKNTAVFVKPNLLPVI